MTTPRNLADLRAYLESETLTYRELADMVRAPWPEFAAGLAEHWNEPIEFVEALADKPMKYTNGDRLRPLALN